MQNRASLFLEGCYQIEFFLCILTSKMVALMFNSSNSTGCVFTCRRPSGMSWHQFKKINLLRIMKSLQKIGRIRFTVKYFFVI